MADNPKSEKPMTTYARLGSISHGSHQPSDLIPAYCSALDDIKDALATSNPNGFYEAEQVSRQIINIDNSLSSIERRQETEDDYYDSESAMYDLEALTELLDTYAPPFAYFGAHEGDGAEFGFWVSWDSIEEAERDGTLVKVNAGDEWPTLDEEVEYVLEVTDHGNGTLFSRDHVELWSVV